MFFSCYSIDYHAWYTCLACCSFDMVQPKSKTASYAIFHLSIYIIFIYYWIKIVNLGQRQENIFRYHGPWTPFARTPVDYPIDQPHPENLETLQFITGFSLVVDDERQETLIWDGIRSHNTPNTENSQEMNHMKWLLSLLKPNR